MSSVQPSAVSDVSVLDYRHRPIREEWVAAGDFFTLVGTDHHDDWPRLDGKRLF
jgi:hypothetical protein